MRTLVTSSTTIDNTSIVIVSTLCEEDKRKMKWEMEGTSGTPKTMIHHIITKYLTKKKAALWWLLHMLFPAQKLCRMELCQKQFTPYEKEGIVFL